MKTNVGLVASDGEPRCGLEAGWPQVGSEGPARGCVSKLAPSCVMPVPGFSACLHHSVPPVPVLGKNWVQSHTLNADEQPPKPDVSSGT